MRDPDRSCRIYSLAAAMGKPMLILRTDREKNMGDANGLER